MNESSKRPMRELVAMVFSLLGHPFVLVPLTIALTTRTVGLGIGVATLTIIGISSVVVHRVRSGHWDDWDVSDPQQRNSFYPMAIIVVGLGTLVVWLAGVSPGILNGFLVATGLLATGGIVTRWTKLSLHTMFGAFCSITATIAGLQFMLSLALLVLAVGWSRIILRRHTLAQVTIGALLGSIGGIILLLLNRVI